jgi:hypothetical protein
VATIATWWLTQHSKSLLDWYWFLSTKIMPTTIQEADENDHWNGKLLNADEKLHNADEKLHNADEKLIADKKLAADVPRYFARHVWSKKPTKIKYTEIDEFDIRQKLAEILKESNILLCPKLKVRKF